MRYLSEHAKGTLMILAASILWGGGSSFAVLIAEAGIDQVTVMIVRSFVTAAAVGAVIVIRSRGLSRLAIPTKLLALYSVVGIANICLNITCYNISCEYLSPSQAIIIHYTFPLLTMACGCAIARERPTALQWCGALLVIAGLYIGSVMGRGIGEISLTGVAWGAVSVAGTVVQFLVGRAVSSRDDADATVQLFYASAAPVIALVIWKSAAFGWGDISRIDMGSIYIFAYPTFGISLAGYLLLYKGMQYVSAGAASLLTSFEVVSTIAMVPLILGEMPTAREWIGGAVVLAAVAMASIRSKE